MQPIEVIIRYVDDEDQVLSESNILMTADRLITTHLISCFGYRVASVKAETVFPTRIELADAVPETPAMKHRWHITELHYSSAYPYSACLSLGVWV
jgi:hypothetical protein